MVNFTKVKSSRRRKAIIMPVKYDLPFTQTSHLLALGSTVLVGVAMSPLGGWWGSEGGQGAWPVIVKVVHLGSFSGWFGTQLWVTFFAGKFVK